MPGTPGGTEGRKGRRERRGRVCTTDRPTRRELGRERESSERGRYRRPPTEAHRTVLRPPAPNPGRSSGTILGRGEEGRERCIREASTASSMLDPRRSPRLAGLCLGGLSRLPQGCTWRSYPSTALNAPPPPHTHTHTRAKPALGTQNAGGAPGSSGPRPSSANSPGFFSACMQVPGNFFCLMEL